MADSNYKKIIDLINSGKKSVKIFGTQKCGTGTVSIYSIDDNRIEYGTHGVFCHNNKTIHSSENPILRNCLMYPLSSLCSKNAVFSKKTQYVRDENKINIALIRNPFDLLVSSYFHGKAGSNDIALAFKEPSNESSEDGFKKFIMHFDESQYPPNKEYPDGLQWEYGVMTPFMMNLFYPYYENTEYKKFRSGRNNKCSYEPIGEWEFIPDYALRLESMNDFIYDLGVWDKEIHELINERGHKPDWRRSDYLPTKGDKNDEKWKRRQTERAKTTKNYIRSHESSYQKEQEIVNKLRNKISLYDEEMIKVVKKVFAYELEVFGYDENGPTDDRKIINKKDIRNIDKNRVDYLNKFRYYRCSVDGGIIIDKEKSSQRRRDITGIEES